jgi:peptidoglycan hydrolase-like protein with peptidoglycan-binding domain
VVPAVAAVELNKVAAVNQRRSGPPPCPYSGVRGGRFLVGQTTGTLSGRAGLLCPPYGADSGTHVWAGVSVHSASIFHRRSGRSCTRQVHSPLSVTYELENREQEPFQGRRHQYLPARGIGASHYICWMAYGTRGDGVKALQAAINHCYNSIPNLVPDGIYGDATKAAVRTVQTQHRIHVDGECGEDTYYAMMFPLYRIVDNEFSGACK